MMVMMQVFLMLVNDRQEYRTAPTGWPTKQFPTSINKVTPDQSCSMV